MSISVFSAAEFLSSKSGRKLSNLQLQKMIYLAHMFYLGEHNQPLIEEKFEAWDYGPVQPDLYHWVKTYGSAPVRKVLHPKAEPIPAESPTANMLERVLKMTKEKSPAWLVKVTHWSKGAWAKHYRKGAMFISIPNQDILVEFRDRVTAARAKR